MLYIAGIAILALNAVGSKEVPVDYAKPDQLFKLIQTQSEPYLIIDIRYPVKYNKGHIPTAVNIPLSDLCGNPPAVDEDMVIIVCSTHPENSREAVNLLKDLGYTRVFNFCEILKWSYELEY